MGPGSLAARAEPRAARQGKAGFSDCGHHRCPPGKSAPGLQTASCQNAPGRLHSSASQDRSPPSPASKLVLELFSCSFALLVLKSGRPDSPGRQPRGQRPRQTLSAYNSAPAASAIRWHL